MTTKSGRKKFLVVGDKGMLGTDLVALLRSDDDLEVESADIDEVDITDAESIERCFDTFCPDAAVNCAAFTNVDACETQEETAHAVNALGPELLAKACEARAIRLVHVSTDYVFNGEKESPYLPADPPDPINAYGRTKLAGEQAVAANCADHLIVRTAWLYGAHGRNFVHTILRLAKEKPELRVIDDQTGSPTWTADLARLLVRLIPAGATGITHATNAGSCTWYEFAREIVGLAGLSMTVKPIPSSDYPTPARRPRRSVLDCSRAELITGITMRNWREALAAFFRTHARDIS